MLLHTTLDGYSTRSLRLTRWRGASPRCSDLPSPSRCLPTLATGLRSMRASLSTRAQRFLEYPDIEVIFADVVDPVGPYGAKALGEPPSVGVAPAVVSAIRDATGVEVRDLPATPDKVLNLLAELEGSDTP